MDRKKYAELKVRYATDQELPVERVRYGEDGYEEYENRMNTPCFEPGRLPERVELPVYIGLGIGKYEFGQVAATNYTHHFQDDSDPDFRKLCLAKVVLSLPLPIVDLSQCVSAMVKSLEKEKEKIRAEAQRQIAEVEERIRHITMIEHKQDVA